ncbi:MAG: hypothetical protein KBT52_01970 [Paraperlucidibaca sp.]|nr:hypothetical protein [Paraperlucidibaca sp.]MBQ0722309.1 hypothetical protein [Paraperlucidibaca sp.]
MNEEVDKSQFHKVKSLFDIFKASKGIKPNKFNIYFLSIFMAFSILDLIVSQYTANDLANITRGVAEVGLNLTVGLLGFLVAGFAIFASITTPKLSIFMASKINPESGVSYLLHSYFNFINVFIFYFIAVAIFFSIIIFGRDGGLAERLVCYFNLRPEYIFCIICFAYLAAVASCVYSGLLLKSFVYNIYHSIMTALRYEVTFQKKIDTSPTPAEPPL